MGDHLQVRVRVRVRVRSGSVVISDSQWLEDHLGINPTLDLEIRRVIRENEVSLIEA